jgi:hypothetical protein
MANFYETITAAINDVIAHGFDSQKRINDWLAAIRKAAEESLVPQQRVEEACRAALKQIYERMIIKGGIITYHEGISRYTLDSYATSLTVALWLIAS